MIFLFVWNINSYVRQVNKNRESTMKAMLMVKHDCPSGCKEVYQDWGGEIGGYSRFCVDRSNYKQGKWVVWAFGKVHIEGFYNNNKRNGIWRWYNDDGSVRITTEYIDDIEANKIN
jgi:antitoxin component YwqK of YwqJK toxin-antitoxin module